jgi:hypothetical protein
MSRWQLRGVAVASLAATVGFLVFFFAAKHRPWLASVAPFGDDPYDAVGSFAVQLAGMAAVLSVLRAVRRYGVDDGIPDVQVLLILRSAAVALLAILVAVIADIVAMIRHPDTWMRFPAGQRLAAFLAIVALAVIGGVGMVVRQARAVGRALHPSAWGRAAAVTGASAVVLGLYPETWHHGMTGAILTAIFGTALLFIEVWGFALLLLPQDVGRYENLLDDVHAAFERARAWAMVGALTGTMGRMRERSVAQWLRTHHWHCIALIALAGGLGLAATQALGEGLPDTARRALLVFGVFTGIETAGIVLGYALFWRLLGLVRVE